MTTASLGNSTSEKILRQKRAKRAGLPNHSRKNELHKSIIESAKETKAFRNDVKRMISKQALLGHPVDTK